MTVGLDKATEGNTSIEKTCLKGHLITVSDYALSSIASVCNRTAHRSDLPRSRFYAMRGGRTRRAVVAAVAVSVQHLEVTWQPPGAGSMNTAAHNYHSYVVGIKAHRRKAQIPASLYRRKISFTVLQDLILSNCPALPQRAR